VIFDSLPTEMPILEFMQQLISINSKCVLLPTASELNLDKISDLLMQGAHGYLEKPFVLDAVDESIVSATKGKPIIDIILGAQDRNKALVDILLQLLDITSIIIRQSKTFSSAQRELPFALNAFRRSSTVARMFCIGGEECLLETIQDLSIARSETAASQIGRLRKLLKDKREAAAPTAN
jgi:DNA-binding response OmpR family regulator